MSVTKMHVLYYAPQGRFKGWLQTDVIPWEFINLYEKEQLKTYSAKIFKFHSTYNTNAKSAWGKKYFTLYDLQTLNIIFKMHWLTLAIDFKFPATELASRYQCTLPDGDFYIYAYRHWKDTKFSLQAAPHADCSSEFYCGECKRLWKWGVLESL